MYKKAGIVIAIILVAAGILVLSISSCNKDGGIQVKQTNSQAEEVNNNKETNDNEQEESLNIKEKEDEPEEMSEEDISELEIIDDTSEEDSNEQESSEEVTESSTESSLSEEDASALEELKEYKEQQSRQSEESSEQKSESSEQSSEIGTEDVTGGLSYKEINYSDLPSDKKEKNVIGIITGKEILVEGNNVFTAIIILDENSDSYRYFVPKSAYDNLEKGTKLDVSIIVYFDGEKSIKQVTGVSVAE